MVDDIDRVAVAVADNVVGVAVDGNGDADKNAADFCLLRRLNPRSTQVVMV